MKIAIATVQVPLISGGAEIMTAGLSQALKQAGHVVDTITLPFRFAPPSAVTSTMNNWQHQNFEYFDCGKIDHVIALKFPAFYLTHTRKTVWLMHQHRSVYELYDTPFGDSSANHESVALRQDVIARDTNALTDARAVFTISRTVSDRLHRYNGVESQALYQPPQMADLFCAGETYPYVFVPSRLESLKRQDLLIKAMALVKEPVFAIIAGEGGQYENLKQLVISLGLQHRVKLIGRIDDATMRSYYSNALSVFFGPHSEDYGFITLEAMLSSKPVITCTDSGGPTEFVINNETGFVVSPEPAAIADAINQMWADKKQAEILGRNGRDHYQSLNISWQNVVEKLVD
jgi:glycosyltransferase involved in cell wall biosynthesis